MGEKKFREQKNNSPIELFFWQTIQTGSAPRINIITLHLRDFERGFLFITIFCIIRMGAQAKSLKIFMPATYLGGKL